MEKQLTKREQDLMELFWKSDQPLSSNDIKVLSNDLSIHTIQQVLRRLTDNGFIKVDGVGFTKNSITRKYVPCITQAKYLKQFIAKNTEYELATTFIKENTDPKVLDELECLIQQSRKKFQ